jgi:uncharacterized protein
MKIGVLSDTHMPKKAKILPQSVKDGLVGVELIIHAGDINSDSLLYELEEIAPVHAVAGNTDDGYIHHLLDKKKIIKAEDIKIGIIHGEGSWGTTVERAQKAFEGEQLDCIVFGHSHMPFNGKVGKTLLFNPGSPTDKRKQENFSYGILTIENGKITGEIKYF